MNPGPIPLTVIAGYLGAGKTTLLKHVVRSSTQRRLVVAVDDFGGINLDAELVPPRVDDLLRFEEGCLCCSLAARLTSTLFALRRYTEASLHVVIESSGVADPRLIAQHGHLPGFRHDGTIVVADATRIRPGATDFVGTRMREQLLAADLVLLNKIDLVSTPDRLAAVRWLHALVPGIQVVETSHARVPALLLFGSHPADDARFARRSNGGALHPPADAGPHHSAAYARWSWSGLGPLREAAFGEWVAALPGSVLRAKGLLCLESDPAHRFVFQHVGSRWSVTRDSPWGTETPGCRVTLIAPAGTLDPESLDRSIGQCLGRTM